MLVAAATSSGVSLSTAQLIVGFLSALGVGSVLAAIVSGFFSRKKLGADATEIITKAASGVVANIESDNMRLRKDIELERNERRAIEDFHESEMVSVRREQDHFRRLAREHTRVLQLHAAWDMMAVQALERCGITDLPQPPPPLYGPELTPSSVSE